MVLSLRNCTLIGKCLQKGLFLHLENMVRMGRWVIGWEGWCCTDEFNNGILRFMRQTTDEFK